MKKLLAIMMCLISTKAMSATSFGVGLGIPYGVFGINLQRTMLEKVDLSLGLGTTLLDGTGYSLGARYYLKSRESGVRLSAYYGTNALIEVQPCTAFCYGLLRGEYEKFEGITLGIGWGHRAARRGWNVDLLYIATSDADDRANDLRSQGYDLDDASGGFTGSFGYHWTF